VGVVEVVEVVEEEEAGAVEVFVVAVVLVAEEWGAVTLELKEMLLIRVLLVGAEDEDEEDELVVVVVVVEEEEALFGATLCNIICQYTLTRYTSCYGGYNNKQRRSRRICFTYFACLQQGHPRTTRHSYVCFERIHIITHEKRKLEDVFWDGG